MTTTSEDRTKRIYRLFLQGIAWRTVADFLIRLRSILLLPILTRTFGKVDYGIWTQIGNSATMLSSLGTFGIGASMHRYLPGLPEEEQRQQFWMSISVVSVGALIAATPFFLFAEAIAIAFFGGAENTIYVYLGGLLMLTKVLQMHLLLYFRLALRINIYSILLVTQSLFSLVAYLLAAIVGRQLITVATVAVLVDVFLVLLVLLVIARTLGFARPNFSPLRKYLVFGLPTLPLGFLNWALNSADRYVVAYYLGPEELAVYAVAYGISLWTIQVVTTPLWTVLPGSLNDLWNNEKKEEAIALLTKSFRYYFLIVTPVACVVLFWGSFIIEKYAGQSYTQGAVIVVFVVIAYLIEYTSSFYRFIFTWYERTRVFLTTFSVAVVANLLLNVILVPRMGILGSAVSTTLAYGLLFVVEVVLSRRLLKPGFPVASSFFTVTIGVLLAGLISMFPHTTWLAFSVQVIGFGLLFLLAMWLTGQLNIAEIRALYAMLVNKRASQAEG